MGDITAFEWANILLRWTHVASAVLWMGLVFFFAFIFAPAGSVLDPPTAGRVTLAILPRARFYYLLSSLSALLAGWALFILNYLIPNAPASASSGRGVWIMTGMTLATLMAYLTWFVISPSHQALLKALRAGEAPGPPLLKRLTLATKANAFLAFPVMFCMLAGAGHFPYATWYAVLGVLAVGVAVGVHLGKIKG